jgi:hypothetical protein
MLNIPILSTIRRLLGGRDAASVEKHITTPTEHRNSWATEYPFQVRVPSRQDRYLVDTRYYLEDHGVHYARLTQSRTPDPLYVFKNERAASMLRHHLRQINVQEQPVSDWWSGVPGEEPRRAAG